MDVEYTGRGGSGGAGGYRGVGAVVGEGGAMTKGYHTGKGDGKDDDEDDNENTPPLSYHRPYTFFFLLILTV